MNILATCFIDWRHGLLYLRYFCNFVAVRCNAFPLGIILGQTL
ncbi:hypothetical protein HMPREF0758_0143 [Serratia odorifera DSM 4582]|uniref:Uncharacterized protein n=1 Tax=Serratia odorifera DSM 4582 TaxID=667129 RepID=D4DW43_SEROD|nr:hypothetical protein HMPREF0758_0143 [Serratia odorifera DSM 4582]